MAKCLNIALYMRLSKEDQYGQGDESNSIHMQRCLLQDYVKSNFEDYNLFEFQDDGFSGTNFERPGIAELLESARQSRIDCVIVKDFSRFSRDYIELGTYIEQIFPFMKIRFISVNDNYDSDRQSGAAVEMDTAFKHLLYDLYSKDLSVKVKSALTLRKKQGQYISGNCPFGYEKNPKDIHKLVIQEDEAAIIRRIFRMTLQGKTSSEIAKQLNKEKVKTPIEFKIEKGKTSRTPKGDGFYWTNSIICQILRNDFYVGDVVYGKFERHQVGGKSHIKPRKEWQLIQNHHKPIISRDDFELVQKSRGRYKEYQAKRNHPLVGRVECGCCGMNLTYRNGNRNPYFRCRSHYHNGEVDCLTKINAMFLEEVVLFRFQEQLMAVVDMEKLYKQQAEMVKRQKQEQEQVIIKWKRELSHLQKLKMEKYEDYVVKNRSLDKSKYDELGNQEKELKHLIKTLETELQSPAGVQIRHVKGSQEVLSYEGITELTNEAVEVLIKKIVVDKNENITIEWNFDSRDFAVE